MGLQRDSVFSLLAGVIFGISYGAGVLISEARSGRITGRQAFLVALFLAVCHAIIEDTLLFVAYGAIWWIPVVVRLILAIAVTSAVALLWRRVGDE